MDFNHLYSLLKEDTEIIDRNAISRDPDNAADKILKYLDNVTTSADEKKHISLGRVYLIYKPEDSSFEYTFTQNAKLDINNNDELKKLLKFNFREGTFLGFPKNFNRGGLGSFLKYIDEADKLSRRYNIKLVYQVYDPDDPNFRGYQTEWPGRISSFKKNWADMVSGFSTFGKNLKKNFSK